MTSTEKHVRLILKSHEVFGRASECGNSHRFFFTIILASYVLAWEMLNLGLNMKAILLTNLALQGVGLFYQELAKGRLEEESNRIRLECDKLSEAETLKEQ